MTYDTIIRIARSIVCFLVCTIVLFVAIVFVAFAVTILMVFSHLIIPRGPPRRLWCVIVEEEVVVI